MSVNEKDSEIEDVSPAPVKSEISDEIEGVPAKRSRLPVYVISTLIGLCLIIGLSWWFYSRQFEKTDDAFIEGNISLISSKISSHIEKVHVVENQFVKKGDLLIELDGREAKTNLEKAQALLQTALAKKSKALASNDLTRKTTRADFTQASSSLSSAENNIEQTRLAADSKLNSVEQAKIKQEPPRRICGKSNRKFRRRKPRSNKPKRKFRRRKPNSTMPPPNTSVPSSYLNTVISPNRI